MKLKSAQSPIVGLTEDIVKEFFCPKVSESFDPQNPNNSICNQDEDPTLFTMDLLKTLDWLHSHEYPRPLEKEVCGVPVLLFVPDFSMEHLLFHFDGSANSVELIKNFIYLFEDLIHDSKATIISPNFTPKSKIREEREIIQLISNYTRETSFIKFNFSRIGDFWSYGVQNNCSLLVTTKNYQADLAKVLFHFYKGKIWNSKLSFYLSI
jgi:hypothetical protein